MGKRLPVEISMTQQIREVEVCANGRCRKIVVETKLQRMSVERHRLGVVPPLHGEHRLDVECLREDFGQSQLLADVKSDLDLLARRVGVALEMQQ